jgi:predicted  nucleic acid-binding Zn-ribbon protein
MVETVSGQSGTAVPIKVAARRMGLSVDAIRKRIARGQLEVRRVNSGRGVHVVLPDEPVEAESEPNDASVELAELRAAVKLLQEAQTRHETDVVAVLRDAVAALKDQLVEKDKQITELQRQVADMSGRRPGQRRGLIPHVWALLFGTEQAVVV